MSTFFCKNKATVWELCQRFFSSVFSFCKIKAITINENIGFTDYASGIRLSNSSKMAINRKNDNGVTVFRHDVIVNFFWSCAFSLVKFSYWSKFYVNIIIGSRVMPIFFYKGLTRDPEIGNIHVWLFIWRLGQVRNTKFDTNICNKMLQNAAKCQGYSFYRFWVIKGKPSGSKITPHPD